MSDAPSPTSVPKSSGTSTPPIQLLGHWRNLTCTHLDPCVSTLLDRADDALFRLAEKAEDNRTQTVYFDAMRELRRKRSTLESDYSTHLMQLFDRLLRNAGPLRQATVEIDTDELSLVGTEELEENLAIDGMVAKARRAHDGELAILQRACGHIMNRTLSAEALPVDPQALCHAFREAMQVIDVDIKVRLIIYKLFEQHVLSELPTLYQEILRYLQQRQIVPSTAQPAHERPAPSALASREPRSVAQDPASVRPVVHDTLADSGSDLLALFQQLSQLHRVSAPTAALWEDQPSRTLPAAPPDTGSGMPQISAEQLTGALSSVATQLLPTQALPQGQHFSAAQLKQAVLGALPVAAGHRPPALNHVDETTIDIVSMLFDFIFDDPALPAPVKALIGRLQIPVLKAAILDKSFFSQKRHPARRLLNELTRAGLSWNEADEHDDGLLAKITEIVETLQQEFDQDSTLFDEALGDFLDFCEQQAQRAAQREEQIAAATQNREQLLLAKGIAAEAIERIIEAHPRLPDPVLRLLRTTWKDLLVLIYIKNGQHGKLWQKALNVASLLVWSLLPKSLPKEREQLAELLPSLRKALQEGMQRMGVGEAEQQTLFSVLAHEHGRMVRSSPTAAPSSTVPSVTEHTPATPPPASATAQTPPAIPAHSAADDPPPALHDGRSFMARKVSEINQLITEGRFQIYAEVASPPVQSSETDIEDMYLLRVKELNEGTWLELLDEANQPLRAKLSWKSLISGKYFFVNRQGLKVREMSIHELAHEFRSGRTRIIEDLPVFDRAVSTLMASLRKDDS